MYWLFIVQMRTRPQLWLFSIALATPAAALAAPPGHEQCIKASDYKGCIEVFSGAIKNQIQPGTQNIKLNIDTQVAADGNECPGEFAYAGGGYCRRVVCVYGGLFGAGHHPDLAGKGVKCPKGIGQMQWGEWDKERVRASVNPTCPQIPFEVGYQSTCQFATIKGANLISDGREAEALKTLQALSDSNPSNWHAAANVTYLLYKQKRFSDAIVYARRAYESVPDGGYKYLTEINLAIMLYSVNSADQEAIRLAKKAFESEPRLRDIRFLKKRNFAPEAIPVVQALSSRTQF
jgi:tetratricopeptide (TPR) repeat protein